MAQLFDARREPLELVRSLEVGTLGDAAVQHRFGHVRIDTQPAQRLEVVVVVDQSVKQVAELGSRVFHPGLEYADRLVLGRLADNVLGEFLVAGQVDLDVLPLELLEQVLRGRR